MLKSGMFSNISWAEDNTISIEIYVYNISNSATMNKIIDFLNVFQVVSM